jgi:intraflagellar transport protein 80
MTEIFIWNDKSDILVALSDDRIYTWYYPNAVYIDRDL